jgi:hypothetical protein
VLGLEYARGVIAAQPRPSHHSCRQCSTRTDDHEPKGREVPLSLRQPKAPQTGVGDGRWTVPGRDVGRGGWDPLAMSASRRWRRVANGLVSPSPKPACQALLLRASCEVPESQCASMAARSSVETASQRSSAPPAGWRPDCNNSITPAVEPVAHCASAQRHHLSVALGRHPAENWRTPHDDAQHTGELAGWIPPAQDRPSEALENQPLQGAGVPPL